jgi:hypothetical protein
MMTLLRASIDADARGLDDLGPVRDLGLDVGCIFLRRIGDRLEADRVEPLSHLGLRKALGDLALQPVDDRLRCAGWHDYAGERVRLLVGDARSRHCRYVGDDLRALFGQHHQTAQVPRFDVRGDRRQRQEADWGVAADRAVERHREEVEPEFGLTMKLLPWTRTV